MPSLLDLFTPGPLQTVTLDAAWIEAHDRARRTIPRNASRRLSELSAAEKTKVAPRTMRVREAAEYLGISEWTLRRHVHNSEIPYVPGKIWRFLITDLDRFLEQSIETKEVL